MGDRDTLLDLDRWVCHSLWEAIQPMLDAPALQPSVIQYPWIVESRVSSRRVESSRAESFGAAGTGTGTGAVAVPGKSPRAPSKKLRLSERLPRVLGSLLSPSLGIPVPSFRFLTVQLTLSSRADTQTR